MIRLQVLVRSLCIVAGCSAVFLSLGAEPARSQTTWNGGTGNWSNPLNWSNGLPSGNSSAAIGNGNSPNPVAVLDINATTSGVSLNSAGVLIASGNSLTTDNLVLSGTNSFVTGATGAETLTAFNISGNGDIHNVNLGSSNLSATGGTLNVSVNNPSNSANFSFFVDAGSTLNFSGQIGNSIRGGDVEGSLKFDDATITSITSGGSLVLDGLNAQIVNKSGTNPFASGLAIQPGSVFDMFNGAKLTTGDFSLRSAQPSSDLWGGSTLTTANMLMGKDLGVHASTLNVNGDLMIGQWGENAGIGLSNGSVLNVAGNLILDRFAGSPALNVSIFADASIATIDGDLIMANTSNHDLCPRIHLSNASAMTIKGDVNMSGFGLINLTDGSVLTVQKNIVIVPVPDGSGGSIGGVVTLANGSTATVNGSVLNNGGSIQIDNSSVLTAKSGLTQSSGSTLVDGLANVGATGMQIHGGSLSGTGVINGNVIMGGTLTPGDPTGAMTIIGNYTQTSTGTLVEQVGWISGFSNNPLFVVGNAKLDGTLDIQSMLGYFPELGDSFILMLFNSSTGKFSNLEGLDFGGGIGFEVEYDQHDVKLVAKEVPEPGALALFTAGLLALAAALCKNNYRRLACRP